MKNKCIAFLALSLIGMVLASPAAADSVLYSNITAQSFLGGIQFHELEIGSSLTDSFVLSNPSTITGLTFASWLWIIGQPPSTLTSVQWAIGTSPFGSDFGSGSQSNPGSGTAEGTSLDDWDIQPDAISISDLSLDAGTYWVTFVSATEADGRIPNLDSSDGPSSAFSGTSGSFQAVDSQTFTILGTTTPEPSSFLLLGSGLVGLAGMIRHRLKA